MWHWFHKCPKCGATVTTCWNSFIDYGKYRYNLAEYLETAAGMVIGLGKNKDLIKIAKPKAEAAPQNEAAQAQKKVAKTTEVIEPLKSEQVKPKKKMAGPNMH